MRGTHDTDDSKEVPVKKFALLIAVLGFFGFWAERVGVVLGVVQFFLGLNKYTGTGTGNAGTAIKFSSLLSFLSFDLFRPGPNAGKSTSIAIDLFNTSTGGGPVGLQAQPNIMISHGYTSILQWLSAANSIWRSSMRQTGLCWITLVLPPSLHRRCLRSGFWEPLLRQD